MRNRTFHQILVIVALAAGTQIARGQTLQWARQFASAHPNATFQIAADTSGEYMVGTVLGALGQIANTPFGFVRKYDSAGTMLWEQQFAAGSSVVGASTLYTGLILNGVALDATGVYVAGLTGSAPPGTTTAREAGVSAAVVKKFDLAGNLLWTQQTTPPQVGTNTEGAVGIAASGGAIYVAGSFESENRATATDTRGVYLRKFDSAGNVQWTTQFGSQNVVLYSVTADSTGIYVVGTTPRSTTDHTDDLFIRKYDTSGNELWEQPFGTGSVEYPWALAVNSSGVYVVGSTEGLLGIQTLPTFDFDAFVRKYDLNGNLKWTQQFGTIDREEALGAYADATGLYVSGYTRSVLAGKVSLGGEDAFLRRFDNDGNNLWTLQTGSVNDDYAFGVASDGTSVYLGGYTDSRTVPNALGKPDSFLYKYSPPAAGGPVVLSGGIVNSASYAPDPAPVAPGSIAAVFGTGLNDGTQVLSSSFDSSGKLVTNLGGTSVTVGGILAPLFYSTSSQLGIQIPWEVSGGPALVVVTVGGQQSPPQTVNISASEPGLYTLTSDGRGTAICVHPDGSLVTTANPAHPNETVTFYGTGFGPISPGLATGIPASLNQFPAPTVTIDGLPATVVFSGMAPALVGLNQLNVMIPGLARQNDADPVVMKISGGGVSANQVTLPVAP